MLLLHAGVQSFKALQTSDEKDDKQWLTFWLLYAIFDWVTAIADYVRLRLLKQEYEEALSCPGYL